MSGQTVSTFEVKTHRYPCCEDWREGQEMWPSWRNPIDGEGMFNIDVGAVEFCPFCGKGLVVVSVPVTILPTCADCLVFAGARRAKTTDSRWCTVMGGWVKGDYRILQTAACGVQLSSGPYERYRAAVRMLTCDNGVEMRPSNKLEPVVEGTTERRWQDACLLWRAAVAPERASMDGFNRRRVCVTPFEGAYGRAGYVIALEGSPPWGLLVVYRSPSDQGLRRIVQVRDGSARLYTAEDVYMELDKTQPALWLRVWSMTQQLIEVYEEITRGAIE